MNKNRDGGESRPTDERPARRFPSTADSRRTKDLPKGFRRFYGRFCRHLGEKKTGTYKNGRTVLAECEE